MDLSLGIKSNGTGIAQANYDDYIFIRWNSANMSYEYTDPSGNYLPKVLNDPPYEFAYLIDLMYNGVYYIGFGVNKCIVKKGLHPSSNLPLADKICNGLFYDTPTSNMKFDNLGLQRDTTKYYKITYIFPSNNDGYLEYFIIMQYEFMQQPTNQPCFSYSTYKKILLTIPNNALMITLKNKRFDKKMIRAIHKDLDKVEFTHDHPFLYNEKIITFEELLKINKDFSDIVEIDLNECDMIYNIIAHPIQTHPDNIFKLSSNLYMIGAKCPENIDKDTFIKRKLIFEKLMKNEDNEVLEILKQKYGIKK